MFEFIPDIAYSNVYYSICFLSALFVLLLHHLHNTFARTNIILFGLVICVFVTFYIGFRPLYLSFGDMSNYHKIFSNIQKLDLSSVDKDPVFYSIIYLLSYLLEKRIELIPLNKQWSSSAQACDRWLSKNQEQLTFFLV